MSGLTTPAAVVTAGAELLADAVAAQAVTTHRVAWQPPAGDPAALASVMADRRRHVANQQALARMLAAEAHLVDVRPAAEALGLERGQFLHAGPPVTWERASGPMRGALIGAMLLEGLADDPEQAEAALAAGDGVSWEPCHHRGAVGPMAGVVTPSMWVFELRDDVHGQTSWCSLNEGLGKVLRYGAYGPEVIDRLRWMSRVLGPLLQTAVRAGAPVDVARDRRPDGADGRRGPQPQPGRDADVPARGAARDDRLRGTERRRRRGGPVRLRQRPLLPQPGDAGLQAADPRPPPTSPARPW